MITQIRYDQRLQLGGEMGRYENNIDVLEVIAPIISEIVEKDGDLRAESARFAKERLR